MSLTVHNNFHYLKLSVDVMIVPATPMAVFLMALTLALVVLIPM